MQLEELGKASDTALMVQCLLPEAQHGATAVLRLHRALMELAAKCNFSAAFAQEKDGGQKMFQSARNEYCSNISPLKKLPTDL